MPISPTDADFIDRILEAFQNSALKGGRSSVAQTFSTMREHLPKDGGVPDEQLVMDLQSILIPVIEDHGPSGPSEEIRARLKEIYKSLDRDRTKQ